MKRIVIHIMERKKKEEKKKKKNKAKKKKKEKRSVTERTPWKSTSHVRNKIYPRVEDKGQYNNVDTKTTERKAELKLIHTNLMFILGSRINSQRLC